MSSFTVVSILLAVCVIGSMAQYGGYPPHKAAPKPYHAPAAHAPAHAPAYHAAPHHEVHAYAAKAPHVKCGANLLVGCAPQVAHVPCVPVHHGGHGGYGAHGGHGGHGYRAFDQMEAEAEE